MTGPELAGLALSWALTYALHSTALLGAAWLLARTALRRSLAAREALWKSALVGGVLTASVQVGADLEPLAGRWSVRTAAALEGPADERDASRPFEPALPVEREPRIEPATSARAQETEPTPERAFAAPRPRPAAPQTRPPEARRERLATAARPRAELPPRSLEPRLAEADVRADVDGERAVAAPAALATAEPPPTRPAPSRRAALGPLVARLWPRLVLGLWGLGGALGLALLAWAWARLADLAAGREPVREGPLLEELTALCRRAGLRRVPRLALSARMASPATVGVLRPQIVVPRRALAELAPEPLRALLAHELAHVARRDPQWSFLARALERALFFQPLNRRARRELAELAEYRADDWAVRQTGQGVCLARCLAEVAGWVLERRPAVGFLPMAEQGSQLGRRIRRLLERDDAPPREERGRWLAPLAPCAVAAVTLVLPHAAAGERAPSATPLALAPAAPAPVGVEERVEELVEAPREEAPPEIERLVALLDAEVAELLAEVDALAGAIDERQLEPGFVAALAGLEARLRSLRAKKERLDRLLPAVLALTQARDAETQGPGTDQGARPREPRRDRPSMEVER